VYNHCHLVPCLIECLARQTLGCKRFELLLVDNASTELAVPQELPEWVRILECPTPGSYVARNQALAHAKAPLLAFTDADCLPQPQWLEGLLQEFAKAPQNSVMAGKILVEPQSWAAPTVYELYDVALGLPQQRYVRTRGYGVTANLAMSRQLLVGLGGFDSIRFSGGDADFCRRATAHGARLFYCESAVVVHPARNSWHELAKKVRRLKGGQIKAGSTRQRLFFAVRTLLPPLRAWMFALQATRLNRWQRVRVCIVQCGLWGVEVKELIRLLAGGRPRRD
jgi:glycosyltransferase involved in cell wall biosynthesis